MKKLVLTNDDVKNYVSKICREMSVSRWIPDYVVGLTRGGLVPAVMISHYFNIPCHTLKVSLRDNADDCESNFWMAEDAIGFDGATNILIVDDINDSGATINWIMKDWQSGCMPNNPYWQEVWGKNVRYAVLVDNTSSQSAITPSWYGDSICKAVEDVWVDFPWESWWER